MKVSERLNEVKIERKKFMLAAGLAGLGVFLLAKFPFRFISNRAERIISARNKPDVRENPASVKRSNV